MRKSFWLWAIMCLVPACNYGPPQVPSANPSVTPELLRQKSGLSPAQTLGVLECEQAIQFQGTEFTTFKEAALNQCLDDTLRIQIAFENNQIPSDIYNPALSQVRAECAADFKAIGAASTRLVNGIASACAPVQNLILPASGYDPLQFGAEAQAQGLNLVGDATGLAGRICGAKELLVDALVDIQTPRMVGLLEILDNGTGQFAVAGPSSTLLPVSTIPNIPLDSRCVFPTLP